MPELEVLRWPQDRPLERESVADVWARDGFSCDLWVDPPGQEWIDFVHSTDERVVVKEGRLEFEVQGARYPGARRPGTDSRRQPPQRLEPRIHHCQLVLRIQAPLRFAGGSYANGAGD